MESEKDFIHNWLSLSYEGKGFKEDAPEFYTAKGERVRSKSEIIIADMLSRNQIPYRYECPLQLKGYGTIYPDFDVLNVRKRKTIRYEHFGMMDDPFYAEKAIKKITLLMQHGFCPGNNLICTFETQKSPLTHRTSEASHE